jgi:hypothetical protein
VERRGFLRLLFGATTGAIAAPTLATALPVKQEAFVVSEEVGKTVCCTLCFPGAVRFNSFGVALDKNDNPVSYTSLTTLKNQQENTNKKHKVIGYSNNEES